MHKLLLQSFINTEMSLLILSFTTANASASNLVFQLVQHC